MVPLRAEILTERQIGDGRSAVRRTLRLGVRTQGAGDVARATVINISQTGLLLETVVKLEVGDTLHVDMAEASAAAVRIVWTDGLLAGCEFFDPVSTAAISAAQLKSPIETGEVTQPSSRYLERPSRGESSNATGPETTLVMISALITVVALIVFLAAVLPL